MTRDEIIATMQDVFGDRIDGPPVERNGWLIWATDKSERTLSKFVARAKSAGVRGVWARDGKVGCRP